MRSQDNLLELSLMSYKYYLRKPKSEIAKDIITWLAIGGAICIAATSPYFSINLMRGTKRWQKYKRREVYDTFRNLQRQGCINIKENNHQIYISLTKQGKKKAGRLQIDFLKIKRPQRWDGKWRIVIFDIAQLKNTYREAFRGKLKELGFVPLQKSVWICPFECREEIGVLKEFFGFSEKEMRLIIAQHIGSDDWLREIFKV